MKRLLLLALIITLSPPEVLGQTPASGIAPGSGALTSDHEDNIDLKSRNAERSAVEKALAEREAQLEYGNRNTSYSGGNLLLGRDRAEAMMRTLQDQQFRRALTKINAKGKQFLHENDSFKTPIAIIAGAATFWFGATIRLFRGESILITSRVEGRNRRAEFTLQSPFLNGKLYFEGATGFNVNINRSIASINSTAELNYISRTQSFSTEFRHPIIPHLDLTIGSSQIPELNNRTDGRAKIEYQFNF